MELPPEFRPTAEGADLLARSKSGAQTMTVFGLHTLRAYVYASGAHEKIALRPIEARLQLSPARASYLLEEFSQYFCVDQAFGQAGKGLERVLRQRLSVNSLERINRRGGSKRRPFSNTCPFRPPRKKANFWCSPGTARACRW